jgi:hypothetical protein
LPAYLAAVVNRGDLLGKLHSSFSTDHTTKVVFAGTRILARPGPGSSSARRLLRRVVEFPFQEKVLDFEASSRAGRRAGSITEKLDQGPEGPRTTPRFCTRESQGSMAGEATERAYLWGEFTLQFSQCQL